jgi:hypothetical protein
VKLSILSTGTARTFNGCSGVSVLLHVGMESGRGQSHVRICLGVSPLTKHTALKLCMSQWKNSAGDQLVHLGELGTGRHVLLAVAR